MAKDAQRKQAIINEKVRSVAYQITLQGAQHMNFSDTPLLEGDNRGLNARRALRIICDYSLAFFNRHLKNQESALLDGASALHPEVKVEKYLSAK